MAGITHDSLVVPPLRKATTTVYVNLSRGLILVNIDNRAGNKGELLPFPCRLTNDVIVVLHVTSYTRLYPVLRCLAQPFKRCQFINTDNRAGKKGE